MGRTLRILLRAKYSTNNVCNDPPCSTKDESGGSLDDVGVLDVANVVTTRHGAVAHHLVAVPRRLVATVSGAHGAKFIKEILKSSRRSPS
jgi:hypothetical protein